MSLGCGEEWDVGRSGMWGGVGCGEEWDVGRSEM